MVAVRVSWMWMASREVASVVEDAGAVLMNCGAVAEPDMDVDVGWDVDAGVATWAGAMLMVQKGASVKMLDAAVTWGLSVRRSGWGGAWTGCASGVAGAVGFAGCMAWDG